MDFRLEISILERNISSMLIFLYSSLEILNIFREKQGQERSRSLTFLALPYSLATNESMLFEEFFIKLDYVI